MGVLEDTLGWLAGTYYEILTSFLNPLYHSMRRKIWYLDVKQRRLSPRAGCLRSKGMTNEETQLLGSTRRQCLHLWKRTSRVTFRVYLFREN